MIELCSNALYSNCIQTISNCSAWFVKSGCDSRSAATPCDPKCADLQSLLLRGTCHAELHMGLDGNGKCHKMTLWYWESVTHWIFGVTMFSPCVHMCSPCFTWHISSSVAAKVHSLARTCDPSLTPPGRTWHGQSKHFCSVPICSNLQCQSNCAYNII